MKRKKKGSITVFLSLVLVLLFSMLLITLEGARLQGASAYLSLLTDMAEDSLAASYYYPLFREYGLFAVDGGAGSGYFSEEVLTEKIKSPVAYGVSGVEGGALGWDSCSVELTGYRTLLTEETKGFLEQLREQTLLEGATLSLEQWFNAEELRDAAQVGEILLKQQEAFSATATVVGELLELMETVDGIATSEQGLRLDREGRLQAGGSFVKELLPAERGEIREWFETEEVYRTVQGLFYNPVASAGRIEQLLMEAEALEDDMADREECIAFCEENIAIAKKEWNELKKAEVEQEKKELAQKELAERMEQWKKQLEREQEWLEALEEERAAAIGEAEWEYKELHGRIVSVLPKVNRALELLDAIEEKQKKAQETVGAYEIFLQGRQDSVSKELLETFEEELESMKKYLGLTEQGYSIPQMRDSLRKDRDILIGADLQGFRKNSRSGVVMEMRRIQDAFSGYTAEGLWFTYGEIAAVKAPSGNVFGTLGVLLSGKLLSLAGIEEESCSEQKISGEDLPSGGAASLQEGIVETMEELAVLIGEGDWKSLFSETGEAVLDKIALGIYCNNRFGDFMEPKKYTTLAYEREYLLFGQAEDKDNLACMAGSLLGIRTLLRMVGSLKNPERMALLQGAAVGMVGFTGIAVLVPVVKYALLFLWALEEAFIEMAAILQGKSPEFLPAGERVSFTELFMFSKELVRTKAALVEETGGPGYEEYLTLFLLLKPAEKQAYFALDLIQENIRSRYRDAFRIRNAVVGATAVVKAKVQKKYNTGLIPERLYQQEQDFVFVY